MNILPGYSLPSNFMLGVGVFVLKPEEGGGEIPTDRNHL